MFKWTFIITQYCELRDKLEEVLSWMIIVSNHPDWGAKG